jgi:hypothetical protein
MALDFFDTDTLAFTRKAIELVGGMHACIQAKDYAERVTGEYVLHSSGKDLLLGGRLKLSLTFANEKTKAQMDRMVSNPPPKYRDDDIDRAVRELCEMSALETEKIIISRADTDCLHRLANLISREISRREKMYGQDSNCKVDTTQAAREMTAGEKAKHVSSHFEEMQRAFDYWKATVDELNRARKHESQASNEYQQAAKRFEMAIAAVKPNEKRLSY